MAEQHRVVIVGGGVAGLDVATHLAGKAAGDRQLAVTLVDRESAYVWKPMLHTIAAGTSNAGAQQTDYAAQALDRGFDYQFGEAIAVDRQARTVRLRKVEADGREIVPERTVAYDTLVLAVGSLANDFGTPGVAEHCARIGTRSQAIAFNHRLRLALLRHAVDGQALTVGIVGGGATGVELAAELVRVGAATARLESGAGPRLQVVLIEAGPRLLGGFPDRVAASTRTKLEQLGVTVRTGARVASVDEDGFHIEGGELVRADLGVWAAGVKAPPLLDTLSDLERTHSGQLVVGETLRTAADPAVYALGDCASARLPNLDKPPPTTAQAAHQQARYLCDHLPALIAGKAAPPARYHDFGALVSLGGYDAYGTLGRFGFFDGFIRGRVAQLGHALLYCGYQIRLHGLWKGSLLWLLDTLGRRVRSPAGA